MIIVKIMNKIVIFGSGGHAKVIFSEVIKLKKFKFLGFVDDFKKKDELIVSSNQKNYYNLGSIKEIINKKNKFKGIIGVGSNFTREKIAKDIKEINKNFRFQQIISKDAIINSNVFVDEGTLIISGTIINTGTEIGKHCIINTSCSIDHDGLSFDAQLLLTEINIPKVDTKTIINVFCKCFIIKCYYLCSLL